MSIDLNGKLDFEKRDLLFPQDVIKEYASQICSQTHGHVLLNVEKYDEPLYEDSILSSSLSSIITATQGTTVQDKLGDISDENNRYEVCLGSSSIKTYKYRLMFLEYRIGGYPVILYVAKDVINSLSNNNDTIVSINDEDNLRRFLDGVLTCGFVLELMQEIYNASVNKVKSDASAALEELKNSSNNSED